MCSSHARNTSQTLTRRCSFPTRRPRCGGESSRSSSQRRNQARDTPIRKDAPRSPSPNDTQCYQKPTRTTSVKWLGNGSVHPAVGISRQVLYLPLARWLAMLDRGGHMTKLMTSLKPRDIRSHKYRPPRALSHHQLINTTMISQKLFQRSFYTTTTRALQLQAGSHRFGSPLAAVSMLPLRRTVATSVGSRPASQNLKHAALNIREEVGNSAADAARSIAGGNMATDYVPPEKQSSFVRL